MCTSIPLAGFREPLIPASRDGIREKGISRFCHTLEVHSRLCPTVQRWLVGSTSPRCSFLNFDFDRPFTGCLQHTVDKYVWCASVVASAVLRKPASARARPLQACLLRRNESLHTAQVLAWTIMFCCAFYSSSPSRTLGSSALVSCSAPARTSRRRLPAIVLHDIRFQATASGWVPL